MSSSYSKCNNSDIIYDFYRPSNPIFNIFKFYKGYSIEKLISLDNGLFYILNSFRLLYGSIPFNYSILFLSKYKIYKF
jgi:hypothetical protein